jgi:MYXO-CTERM domain-containing protein
MKRFIAATSAAVLLTFGTASVVSAQEDLTEEATNDEGDTGLIGLAGLLGLAGLFGLVRRDRDRSTHRDRDSSTYRDVDREGAGL